MARTLTAPKATLTGPSLPRSVAAIHPPHWDTTAGAGAANRRRRFPHSPVRRGGEGDVWPPLHNWADPQFGRCARRGVKPVGNWQGDFPVRAGTHPSPLWRASLLRYLDGLVPRRCDGGSRVIAGSTRPCAQEEAIVVLLLKKLLRRRLARAVAAFDAQGRAPLQERF